MFEKCTRVRILKSLSCPAQSTRHTQATSLRGGGKTWGGDADLCAKSCESVSRTQSSRWRGRITVGGGRTPRFGARDRDCLPEEAKRLVPRTGRARVEHAAVALAMQLLPDGLEQRPGPPTRRRQRQIQPSELRLTRKIGDVVHGNRPAPQVAWHPVGGRERQLGEHAIPLGPRRRPLVSEVDCCDRLAPLPATTGRRRGQPQRIGPMRDLPPPGPCD